MAKKEKVSLIRAEDFESVDSELTEALSLLEASNAKVEALLHQEHEPEGFEVPKDFKASTAASEEAEDTPAMHGVEGGDEELDEDGDEDGDEEEEYDDEDDGEDEV